jgi:hypothetical protein
MLLVICACGSVSRPGSQVGAQPTASGIQPATSSSALPPAVPPAGGPPSEADLEYRLIDGLGAPFYCDPSLYPVARSEDPVEAAAAVAALRSRNPAEFDAIVRHEHLNADNLSPADNLRILSQASELAAVPLTPRETRYDFRYEVVGPPSAMVTGTIDRNGAIDLVSRTAAPHPQCPVCLAQWTRIATPAGELPVAAVRPGMLVWTLDARGRRVAAPVLVVGHTPTPAGHQVVHLMLADGRSVDVSPGHPLADGRAVGDLAPGDQIDGSVVVGAARRPYDGVATWDLLPAGPTHLYWADGVLLRSTLAGTASSSAA